MTTLGDLDLSPQAVAGLKHLLSKLGVGAEPRHRAVVAPAKPARFVAAPQHNGKAFEAMAPIERKRLKDSNPELYNTMRDDALARGAI